MTRITTNKLDSQYRNTKLTNNEDHLNAPVGVTSVGATGGGRKELENTVPKTLGALIS